MKCRSYNVFFVSLQFRFMKFIRVILFILNLILAVGLLLTTVAGSFNPSRIVLPNLLAYGYLPMLAANMLMILLWGLMKRWEALVSIAVIAMRWSMVGLFVQVGGTGKVPDREEHPDMVTVLNYNVRGFHGRDNNWNHPDSNAREFLKLVREHQPDVMCLQEYAIPSSFALNDSLMLLGYNHYYGTNNTRKGIPSGSVVYSRLPITYVNRLDDEKLLVELLKEKRKFRVCCVHMDSYEFDKKDREEIERLSHGEVQESSRRTFGKVKRTLLCHEREWGDVLQPVVENHSVPMLLAGDLNDIPNSWLCAQIRHEMKDTYCEKGSGLGITYNDGKSRLLPSGPEWLLQFRIDAVFRSEGFRTLSHRRIKTDLSDHYPLLVSLELEK